MSANVTLQRPAWWVLVGQEGAEHLLCMAELQRDGWGPHQEIGGLEMYV